MKFPSFSQWKQIFKVLKKGEKNLLALFFLLAVSSFIFLVSNFYFGNTKIVPALGGTYTEGVVGQPRFINPIYGEINDTDRTLIDLVFSGLMTYDDKGEVISDLADSYKISDDGKSYEFTLKDNIFWHDGKPLTADDVVFTIGVIQSAEYKSPLRANWIDIGIEKISDKSLKFTLKSPYNAFLENCTVKIIPKHIWENISAQNFSLSYYNLQPIGLGPFQFSNISQTNSGFIKSITLTSYRKYHNHPSYISNLSFQFFESKNDLAKTANARKINGFTLAAFDNNESMAQEEISQGWSANEKFSVYSFSMPRYFAVFFNNSRSDRASLTSSGQKSSIFSDSNIRKALVYGVNKDELIQQILAKTKTDIFKVDSPILPAFFGYADPKKVYEFNIGQAKTLLDKSGFKDNGQGLRVKDISKVPAFQFKNYLKVGSSGKEVTQLQQCLARLGDTFNNILQNEVEGKYGKSTEDAVTQFQKEYLPDLKPTGETGVSTRQKLNELCLKPSANSQPLEFSLVTINQPQLVQVANQLKNYWQGIGASVKVRTVSITELKSIIKNRDYDALLYGEALGAKPDLYPFWHSSQRIDPGLNLSVYENKDVDKLLKDAREALDESVKKEKYEKLQEIIINDAPALFLYNPNFMYWVSQKVKGINDAKIIDPAKRFANVTNWYLKTKRTWK